MKIIYCEECGNVIYPEDEYYLKRWIDEVTEQYFCDEICLLEYMKENGEVEEC